MYRYHEFLDIINLSNGLVPLDKLPNFAVTEFDSPTLGDIPDPTIELTEERFDSTEPLIPVIPEI